MDSNLNLDEGTYLKAGGEIRSFSYYSRYTVAANTTPTKIFAAKQGDANFTRLDQTNMPLPSQIPSSQKFVVKGISVAYWSFVAKSDANFLAITGWLASTVLEFNIQDKTPMFQQRLSTMLGLGLALFNDPTTAAEPVNNTLRSMTAHMYRLERFITLAAQTPFWNTIYPGVAAAAQQVTDGDWVDVGLHGDLWTKV